MLDALSAESVRVPDDVLVTGFDGTSGARLSEPALTTVRQPMEAMGRAAAASSPVPSPPPTGRRSTSCSRRASRCVAAAAAASP
ncbi:substrate-binding domain-containing protein [Microbacterium sp. 10M-3C3]|uniref:substrate-binding domain-containing protein n=1 Tax=Microbacterium sp. 10M-3C3 TaxID=2483401 RepID=UPI000F6419AD